MSARGSCGESRAERSMEPWREKRAQRVGRQSTTMDHGGTWNLKTTRHGSKALTKQENRYGDISTRRPLRRTREESH